MSSVGGFKPRHPVALQRPGTFVLFSDGLKALSEQCQVPPQTPKTAASATADMASQGDPRVLAVMNLVLSFAFSAAVVWGFAFIDVAEFSWTTVGLATLTLFLITWVLVMRR